MRSVDIDLIHQHASESMAIRKLFYLLIGTRLLSTELIAWESHDLHFVLIIAQNFTEFLVILGGQASVRRDIGNHNDLTSG